MTCRHAPAGECTHSLALPLYGPRPSAGVCGRCEHYDGPPRGLGDVIATVTHFAGIRPCEPCQRRREALNEISKNLFK